jgi:hypothetical protein
MYTNRNLFCQTGLQICGKVNITAIQTKTVQHFGGFFDQIFSSQTAPANKKKGFCINRVPKKQELEAFIYLAAQNFELFSNIRDQN